MPDINFNISFSVHPVSTNDMYFHMPKKTKNGKLTTYAIRTPELKKFQKIMSEEILPQVYPQEYVNQLQELVTADSEYGISLVIVYLMPKDNYFSSDTSNYLKSLEDTIVKHIKVDDKFNVIITIAKGISSDDNWEILVNTSVCPKISESNYKKGGSHNE